MDTDDFQAGNKFCQKIKGCMQHVEKKINDLNFQAEMG